MSPVVPLTLLSAMSDCPRVWRFLYTHACLQSTAILSAVKPPLNSSIYLDLQRHKSMSPPPPPPLPPPNPSHLQGGLPRIRKPLCHQNFRKYPLQKKKKKRGKNRKGQTNKHTHCPPEEALFTAGSPPYLLKMQTKKEQAGDSMD